MGGHLSFFLGTGMDPAHTVDMLGPPALKIAGLQLWVHGRQFPEANDYWDGNWLNVTAHCGANGASIWALGAIVMVTDIARWIAECEELYKRLQGEATLDPCEPNLHVTIRALDGRGHMTMRVQITPEH